MFLEKELSYKMIGCFFRVANQYGTGHRENLYDRAFQEELDKEKLMYVSKPRIPIYSLTTGKKIGTFIPDYLIENKIVVELKARPFLREEEKRQLLEYLKISPYEIGYLINFGENSLKPKRFIYTNDRKPFLIHL